MNLIEKRITVIVPMFNEEENIRYCVDILRSQTNQNFEVIFIDDGSTDRTVDFLKKYLNKVTISFNYKLIQQKNKGAAQARERGVKESTTPYIFIFDADDHLSPDAIEATEKTLLNNPDISLPQFKIEQGDGSYTLLQYPDNKMLFSGIEALGYTLGKWEVPGVMCVRREIFLKSYELYQKYNPQELNYMNNDEVISRFNFYYAKQVVRNLGTYTYKYNQASTTKKINPNRYLMAKNVQILYQCFGKNMGEISYKMQEEYINVLWGLIKYLRRNKKDLPNSSDWITQIKELVDFIEPDLKSFKFKSVKMISRKWLSLFSNKIL